MTRRMLALTWMMPPLIFPRSLQISRTLRAMNERGWDATVVAVPPAVEPLAVQDPRLAAFYESSYKLLPVEPREEVAPSPLWLRMVRRVLRTENVTPLNWLRRASKALSEQILADRPDVFVSFAQPWVNHVVALRVKRRFPDLPWVAHFSDPWVDSPYFNPVNEKERRAATLQEREIIAAADAVVFTTRETAELVMGKYPTSWRNKAHVVCHGYDADLVKLVQPRSKSEKLTIVHTGNLYEKREPLALLRALSALGAEDKSVLHVNFVGFASTAMRDMVAQLELDEVVSLSSSVPYFDSLAVGLAADLLLVIDAPAEHSVFLPSKIVDCLALNRPILALTPPHGASARVLGGLGFPVIDPTDEAGIRAALHELLQRWRNGVSMPLPSPEALRQFDIREVAKDFENVLVAAEGGQGKQHV